MQSRFRKVRLAKWGSQSENEIGEEGRSICWQVYISYSSLKFHSSLFQSFTTLSISANPRSMVWLISLYLRYTLSSIYRHIDHEMLGHNPHGHWVLWAGELSRMWYSYFRQHNVQVFAFLSQYMVAACENQHQIPIQKKISPGEVLQFLGRGKFSLSQVWAILRIRHKMVFLSYIRKAKTTGSSLVKVMVFGWTPYFGGGNIPHGLLSF